MLHIPRCQPQFDLPDFQSIPREILKDLVRPRKRLTELLFKTALDPPTPKQLDLWTSNPEKYWNLKLLRSPQEIHADSNGKVSSITLGINKLIGDKFDENQKVEATSDSEKLECGLVLRSIGYFAVPVESDIPYDAKKGIVPNVDGKVEPGLYCAGWLATGPRGVIVDTMTEAFKVGQTVADDLVSRKNSDKLGFQKISSLLDERGVKPVYFEDWEKIDLKEKELGEPSGKPREKFTKVHEMMKQLE